MVLASQFAPIRGIWAGFLTSARGTHRRAIYESAIPVDPVSCLEFRQQPLKNALPNPRFLPLPKAAQAGVSGGEITGGRKPPPRNTRPQDEKDTCDNPPGVSGLSASELHTAVFLRLGDQRLKAFPKVVGQNRFGHEEDLHGRSPSNNS